MTYSVDSSNTGRLKRGLTDSWARGASELLSRMNRCGSDDWNGHFTCRTPGCDSCRGRYIASQRRQAIRRFANTENSDLAFVSIVIGAGDSVDDVANLFAKFKKDLRNDVMVWTTST